MNKNDFDRLYLCNVDNASYDILLKNLNDALKENTFSSMVNFRKWARENGYTHDTIERARKVCESTNPPSEVSDASGL